MPRPPRFAPSTLAMPGAVFSPIADRMSDVPGGVCPLHIGDTWLEPFAGARMEDLRSADHPGLHRYGATRGRADLIDAIVEKVRTKNALPCERGNVLVAAGATGALGAALGAITSPGDEVLIAAPYWPLIRGIVASCRATPVDVPFYDRVTNAEEAVAAVAARATPRTVALYVSSPSNPTGRVLPADWLEALAAWAVERGVWLISDEVYEDYVYAGEHVSPARFAPDHTLSVYSFSKAYGMAGNRTGYLVAPAEAVVQSQKISTHTFYHAPTSGQVAGLRALRDGDAWIERARAGYAEVGAAAAAKLGIAAPEGGTFLFVDVSRRLDERGLWGFLEDCVDDGVALAPGPSCGADYNSWVRLCFTAAPPDEVLAAVDRIAERLRGD